MSEKVSQRTVRTVPYPGGKTLLAPWVCENLPAHECYVEPFAGSAAVLAEKDRSRVEVLNDADEMLVRAYRTIRADFSALLDRLDTIAFSRTTHERWNRHLETGDWPEDDVEATARWFFLRYSQHSAKLTGASGFKTSKKTNPARAWANAKRHLPALADRLDGVILECGDWMDVAEQYDGEETVQYFDPPYAEGKGDELYRHSGEFNHGRLADWIEQSDSRCLVSYETVPDAFDPGEYHVLKYETTYSGSARDDGECKEATERLLCNFDPETVPSFVDKQQMTLATDGGADQW